MTDWEPPHRVEILFRDDGSVGVIAPPWANEIPDEATGVSYVPKSFYVKKSDAADRLAAKVSEAMRFLWSEAAVLSEIDEHDDARALRLAEASLDKAMRQFSLWYVHPDIQLNLADKLANAVDLFTAHKMTHSDLEEAVAKYRESRSGQLQEDMKRRDGAL